MNRWIWVDTVVAFSVVASAALAQTDVLPAPINLKTYADPTKTTAAPNNPPAAPVAAEVNDAPCVDLEIRFIQLVGPVKPSAGSSKPADVEKKGASEPKATLASPMPPIRLLSKEDVADFMKSCQADPRSNILFAPRMLLPLGRKGEIRNGVEIPYVTGTVGKQDAADNQEIKLPTDFVGTAIDATVTVSKPGLLRVNLMVEHSTVTAHPVEPGQRPAKDVRRVQTVVECPNGQTAMLRGLKSQQQSAVTTRVPVLGDIPVLGDTFSKKRVNAEEVELVLLVTPVLRNEPPQ